MAISKLSFPQSLTTKQNGSQLTPAEWNTMVSSIQTTVNALVDSANTNPSTPTAADFFVNGTKRVPTNGIVQLACFGESGYPSGGYKLSGTLDGKVVLGTSASEPTDDTEVELCGVTIKNNDDDNAAIMYMPKDQTLNVTISKNTDNYLVCSKVVAMADSQKGCLWSENNMLIQGVGYLACVNKGGHGVKASELTIFGNPHIYVDAIHDAIHGNSEVNIYGGTYYITNANDAFGTRAESGTPGATSYKSPGEIKMFKGSIYAYGVKQNVLDSKAQGYIFGKVSINTDVASGNILSGVTVINPLVYYGNAVQNTDGGYTVQPTGTVKCYTSSSKDSDGYRTFSGETIIEPVNGVYTTTTKIVVISGYIDGKIYVPVKTSDIYVEGNAYVTGDIEYKSSDSKGKLGITSERVGNLVIGGNIISNSNIAIEVKSGCFCNVKGSLDGGDITFNDTKGVCIINGDVNAKIVYVGTSENADATKKLWGAFLVDGDVNIVLNSKHTKGNLVTLKEGVVGSFYANTIDSASVTDLKGSSHIFYHHGVGMIIGEESNEDKLFINV